MKKSLMALAAAMLFSGASVLSGADAFPKLEFSQANETGLYKCGDKTVLAVVPKDDKGERWTKGKLHLMLRYEHVKILLDQTLDLNSSKAIEIPHTFDKPGFISLWAEYLPEDGGKPHQYWTSYGAGADPEQLQAAAPPPADLLSYWQGEYKKLCEKVPAKFEFKQMKDSGAFKRTLITTDMGDGKHFYAVLAIPKNYSKNKPLPLKVTVLPAGNWGHDSWEYPGFMCLTISVFTREFPDKKDYDPNYMYKGANKGREAYFYHDSILGAMRMVDYVQTRPEWDKKNMIAMGQSQGGAFSLYLAALCPKITAAIADVPGFCDFNGSLMGRRGGSPEYLLKKFPDFAEDSRYYDAANFACFVKCPTMMATGFIDTICISSSVYVAYNNLKCEKSIYSDPLTGHGYGRKGKMFQMMPADEFIQKHLIK